MPRLVPADGSVRVGNHPALLGAQVAPLNTANQTASPNILDRPPYIARSLRWEADLDVGETVICTAVAYAVTQADIDAGSVTNLATASAAGTSSNQDSVVVTATQTPALTLVKSTTTTNYATPGDVLDYSYSVTNIGNVTLAEPVTIADDKTPATCALSGDGDLDVGETVICTAVAYAVTQADIDAGSVTNLATASAAGTSSNQDSVVVTATQNPAITVVKTGAFADDGNLDGFADPGESISYTFAVSNGGNVTLTNVTVTDPLVTVSGSATTLGVGETDTTTFTASYIITQADIDTGTVPNTATADSDESDPAVGPTSKRQANRGQAREHRVEVVREGDVGRREVSIQVFDRERQRRGGAGSDRIVRERLPEYVDGNVQLSDGKPARDRQIL